MAKFKTLDGKDQSLDRIEDAQLDAVVGGSMRDYLSPQLALASYPVGGWIFKDVFAKPTLGTYH
jgi:hypothetical protein